MSNNWLVNHAINNVWCDPSIDGQYTMQLAKLSNPEGDTYGMQVSGFSILLPTDTDWYHVYQIGNMSTAYVGIPQLHDVWNRLDQVLDVHGSNIKVYGIDGRLYPNSLIWIRQLNNDNVILALSDDEKQIDLKTTTIYVSFYDGQFRNTPAYTDEYKLGSYSKLVRNQAEIENVFRQYQLEVAKRGSTQAYVNGRAVSNLTNETVEPWDYVDIIRDGIVRESYSFNVKDLLTFNSTLDKARKYLIHPNKNTTDLDFTNDYEIFIYNKLDGRYFPIHRSSTIRQLTHRDLSISVQTIQDIRLLAGWPSLDDLIIKVNIRWSGLERKLIHETTQISELYKMSDECIVNAMVGINSTIVEWQAANLEQSNYCRLMAARYYDIDKQKVTDVYGYNAVSKYISDTPIKAKAGLLTLPPLINGKVSVYEYDADGNYLGLNIINHLDNVDYTPVNVNCQLIEPLIGVTSETPPVHFDAVNFTVVDGFNYRFFKSPKKDGTPTYANYVDITDTDEYSIGEHGKVLWNLDLTKFTPAVASDASILHYTTIESMEDGIIDFQVCGVVDGDKEIPYHPYSLSLYIGQHQLLPEIDYCVQWPRIIVFSKMRLGNEANFAEIPITVRAVGLTKKYEAAKIGYVVDGLLSNNTRFDLNDVEVNRIVVAGQLKHHSDVHFREDQAVGIAGISNGTPYIVDDTIIPLRNVITYKDSIYTLKMKERELRHRLEDYLSIYIPQAPTVVHNPIANRYKTFSPIMNKIISDLYDKILVPVEDDATNLISTQQFDSIMENYLQYLSFDPIRNGVNTNYVVVEPHAYAAIITLTALQYSLIERINKRYLGNKIVLNKLLTVRG